MTSGGSQPKLEIAVRTLILAGFTIIRSHRQPRHIEIFCERTDVLTATIPYLIVLTDQNDLTNQEIEDIQRTVETESRILVIIAKSPGEGWISWEDFTEALGGAVPSWQVLGPTYDNSLIAASKNLLPVGMSGEAWLIFEDLIVYGLEFIFGRRVRRLGGRKRGKPVSDMLAQISNDLVLVVDAKAAKDGFDATWPALRALVEYVRRQQTRQRGQLQVFGVLAISSGFGQNDGRLTSLSLQFFGETQVLISFIEVDTLIRIINHFRDRPDLRNAIRWNSILTGGRIKIKSFEDEFLAAKNERINRGK